MSKVSHRRFIDGAVNVIAKTCQVEARIPSEIQQICTIGKLKTLPNLPIGR